MKSDRLPHEGRILLDYLKQSGISRKEFCNKLGLSTSLFSYHCRKEILPETIRGKLIEAGINIFSEGNTVATEDQLYIQELQEEVRLLTQVITLQKQFIEHLTVNCKHGHCLNFVLREGGSKFWE